MEKELRDAEADDVLSQWADGCAHEGGCNLTNCVHMRFFSKYLDCCNLDMALEIEAREKERYERYQEERF